MYNLALTALIGVITFVGGRFLAPQPSLWDNPVLNFGSISYPSSLDSLTNPAGTDSVSTVSHSGQHSNANDAIEALEAKVGTGASTAVTNSLFTGTSAGVSSWSTGPTLTNLTMTGSTTLQNFTFVNATGTSATTTNSFATTASSTNLFGSLINGFSLSACTGTNFVQWSGGSFGCASGASAAGVSVFSTTTTQQMSTTTLRVSDGSLPDTNIWEITFVAPNTVGSTRDSSDTVLYFNSDAAANYSHYRLEGATAGSANDIQGIPLYEDDADRPQQYFRIKIINNQGMPKFASYDAWRVATTSTQSFGPLRQGSLMWENTAKITQIDIGLHVGTALFGTSTQIRVIGSN